MSNVVFLKQYQAYNIDALNRTAKCDEDIDNGCVFVLNEQSTQDGESMVWVAEKPSANSKDVWMATSPEVVITKDAMGNEYKGITVDPRAFVNHAGRMIDATKLVAGDIVEMTGAGITGIEETANIYLVPSDSYTLVASPSAGTGFCLKKIGVGKLHIGTGSLVKEPVTSYKFECKNN